MPTMTRRGFALLAAGSSLAVALPTMAQTAPSAARNRAVFQVTENDPARWNLILNNMQFLREGVAGEPIEIELVAYGPGLMMLKADSSVKERLAAASKSGVVVVACQNTMAAFKLAPSDMLGEVGYVPSGVVEVMRKQQQGWSYIRS